jgi:hypothetical protein
MKKQTLPTYEISTATVLKMLLWREWFEHKSWLQMFLSFWVILLIVVPIIAHPVFILILSIVFSMAASLLLGGSDATDNRQEFMFTLPSTRAELFYLRFGLGMIALLLFIIISHIALKWGWSQAFWGLFVETVLTEPYRYVVDYRIVLYSFVIPISTYLVTFSCKSMANTPTQAHGYVLPAILVAGLLIGGGFYSEYYFLSKITGVISSVFILVIAVFLHVLGFYAYCGKEAITAAFDGPFQKKI